MMIWRKIQGLTLELSRHSCSKENLTLANVLIDYFELHKFGKMNIIYMYIYVCVCSYVYMSVFKFHSPLSYPMHACAQLCVH